MPHARLAKFLRHAATLVGVALLVPILSACPAGDVGAPCNHGDVEPPQAETVTFPALSCNDLLCVYADTNQPEIDSCTQDDDCNVDQDVPRFECSNSTCRLNLNYVLDRSMCSRDCETDNDCLDGGITDRVLAQETKCVGAFKCVILQKLGDFCCKSLCVCSDDLNEAVSDTLKAECDGGLAATCDGSDPEEATTTDA
jgi:hypothetical protein